MGKLRMNQDGCLRAFALPRSPSGGRCRIVGPLRLDWTCQEVTLVLVPLSRLWSIVGQPAVYLGWSASRSATDSLHKVPGEGASSLGADLIVVSAAVLAPLSLGRPGHGIRRGCAVRNPCVQ